MIADIQDLQFRLHVERLHLRGPRALAEMLIELGQDRSMMTPIEQAVVRYGNIPMPALPATGGDQWPAVVPLRRVRFGEA